MAQTSQEPEPLRGSPLEELKPSTGLKPSQGLEPFGSSHSEELKPSQDLKPSERPHQELKRPRGSLFEKHINRQKAETVKEQCAL